MDDFSRLGRDRDDIGGVSIQHSKRLSEREVANDIKRQCVHPGKLIVSLLSEREREREREREGKVL